MTEEDRAVFLATGEHDPGVPVLREAIVTLTKELEDRKFDVARGRAENLRLYDRLRGSDRSRPGDDPMLL